MPRRRPTRRTRNDPFLGWLALFAVVFVGALFFAAVSAFWNALVVGDPYAIGVVVVVFLGIGGATAFFVYRFLIRRERRRLAQQQVANQRRAEEERRMAARRLAEQRVAEQLRAEQTYLEWLRSADMARLDQMTGIEFEHALGQLFVDLGFGTVVTQASRDYGADLVLTRGGQKTVVQAKRNAGALGLDAVQEAASARMHYGAVRAIVVTNSHFTAAAQALALSNHVELWDRVRLNEELASVAEWRRSPSAIGEPAVAAMRSRPPIIYQRTSVEAPSYAGLDPLFAQAARAVAAEGTASVSLVKTKFNVDYARAGRIVDQLADHGVIGPYHGSRSREVLMTLPDVDDLLERLGIE